MVNLVNVYKSQALTFFIALWIVMQVMIAPKYGQDVANIFGWNAFALAGIFLMLEWIKNVSLLMFGKRESKPSGHES